MALSCSNNICYLQELVRLNDIAMTMHMQSNDMHTGHHEVACSFTNTAQACCTIVGVFVGFPCIVHSLRWRIVSVVADDVLAKRLQTLCITSC